MIGDRFPSLNDGSNDYSFDFNNVSVRRDDNKEIHVLYGRYKYITSMKMYSEASRVYNSIEGAGFESLPHFISCNYVLYTLYKVQVVFDEIPSTEKYERDREINKKLLLL